MVAFLYFIKHFLRFNESKERKTYIDLEYTAYDIELYKKENGDYPTETKGLIALIEPSEHGPYLRNKDDILDRWRRQIVYKRINCNSKPSFFIYSVGANGIDEGGLGDDIKFPRKPCEEPKPNK